MPDGAPVDYRAAVSGKLALAPNRHARAALAEDYQRMVQDGLLLDDDELRRPAAALPGACDQGERGDAGGRMTLCPRTQERVPTTACRLPTNS
jgi:hypothetical protein